MPHRRRGFVQKRIFCITQFLTSHIVLTAPRPAAATQPPALRAGGGGMISPYFLGPKKRCLDLVRERSKSSRPPTAGGLSGEAC